MFSMFIKAPTMVDLRKKLIEAIEGMSGESIFVQETQAEDLGYKPVKQVTHDKKAESMVVPAAVPPVAEMPTFHAVAAPVMTAPPVTKPLVTAMPSYIKTGVGEMNPAPFPSKAQMQERVRDKSNDVAPALDSKGYAWDERIHASSKALTKDGRWRTKRGVKPEEVYRIQNESARTVQSAPAPVAAPPAPQATAYIPPVPASPFALPPTVAQPWTPPQAPSVAAVPLAPTPAAPTYQNVTTPPPQVQKPAHTLETFRDKIIDTFVLLLSNGSIDQHYIEALKAHFQVKEVWDVKDNPAQLQELFENFVASGLVTRIG